MQYWTWSVVLRCVHNVKITGFPNTYHITPLRRMIASRISPDESTPCPHPSFHRFSPVVG
jgi:hypothetical protein